MTETELLEKMKNLGGLLRSFEIKKREFEKQTADLNDQIDKLKSGLKEVFLERKESMTTDRLVVQYRKGTVRWDTATLNVYVKTHPEMAVFQKIDKPTVAFSLPKEWMEDENAC